MGGTPARRRAKADTPKKKDEAPKKKDEAAKTKEAPKPPTPEDRSVSVDLDNEGVGISQALIRFDDIFGNRPGQIPPGSTVTSATLTVNGNDAGGGKIYVHSVLGNWDPSTLTWDKAKFGENKDGGLQVDEQDVTAAFGSFDSKRTGTFEIDVLPAVKLWVTAWRRTTGLPSPRTAPTAGTSTPRRPRSSPGGRC